MFNLLFFLEMIISTWAQRHSSLILSSLLLLFLKLPGRRLFTAANQVGFAQTMLLEPTIAPKKQHIESTQQHLAPPRPLGKRYISLGNSLQLGKGCHLEEIQPVVFLAKSHGNFFFFLTWPHCCITYLWLHWVFIAARGLSLVVATGGYALAVGHWLLTVWFLLFQSTASRRSGFSTWVLLVVAHGPLSVQPQQLWLPGSRTRAQLFHGL